MTPLDIKPVTRCLAIVVKLMGEVIAGKGKLCRYGGDEFAALLPNFSVPEAEATAERIRAGIEAENPAQTVKGVLSAGLRNAGGGYFFAARMRRTEVRPMRSRRAMAALATPAR